jgi:hypothetical protein
VAQGLIHGAGPNRAPAGSLVPAEEQKAATDVQSQSLLLVKISIREMCVCVSRQPGLALPGTVTEI